MRRHLLFRVIRLYPEERKQNRRDKISSLCHVSSSHGSFFVSNLAQVDPEIQKQIQLLSAILQLKSLEALMLPVWLTSCTAEVSSFTSETREKVAEVHDFTSLRVRADDSFKNTGKWSWKSSSVPSTSVLLWMPASPCRRLFGVLNRFNALAGKPTLISCRNLHTCSLLKSHPEHLFV